MDAFYVRRPTPAGKYVDVIIRLGTLPCKAGPAVVKARVLCWKLEDEAGGGRWVGGSQ
jgi:hypothetical protein